MQTSFAPAQVGPFTAAEIIAQLRSSALRFTTLTSQVTDPAAASRHLPGWTAAEIVRHVTVLPEYYNEIASGTAGLIADATQMAGKNEENMARVADLRLDQCAERILGGIDAFCGLVDENPTAVVAFQARSKATLAQAAAIAVGEYEVHGRDLAAAIGAPWRIGTHAAAMCVMAALPVAGPQWTDRTAAAGHSGSYRIKLRGGLGAVRVEFIDGEPVVHGSPDPAASDGASTLITADPVALLQVFYRRQPQWAAIAKGQLLAYGTRPIRALTLKDKFLPI